MTLVFDEFSLDVENERLMRSGRSVNLKPQPFRLLCLLVEHRGHVVTREEIQQCLWARDTFVDVDTGINSCIRQIRRALDDDPDAPRFVQTVPRRGYRFVTDVSAPVEPVVSAGAGGRLVVAGALGAAIAVASLAAVVSRTDVTSGPRAMPTLERPRQLTSAQGEEQYPSWSPDGKFLAYATLHGPNWDVVVMQLGSGEPLVRTADYGGDDLFPSWSPDGARIAFTSMRGDGGVYVMPTLAGAATKLTNARVFSSAACWSSDGRKLSYVTAGAAPIYLETRDLETGTTSRVELPGETISRSNVSCSPDGRLIAYADIDVLPGRGASTNALRLLDVPGGTLHELTNNDGLNYSPSWSPDGKVLYYVSNRAGELDLWGQYISEDGRPAGEPQPLTSGVGMRSAAVSPAGDKLAYARGKRISNIWRVPLLADRRASWGDAEPLTVDEAFVEAFDLSVERGEIVLSSDRSGTFDLWVQSIEGGELRQLTSGDGNDFIPSWSSDGESVLFHSSRASFRDLWRVGAEGGGETQLTTHPDGEYYPAPSPLGAEIAFVSNRDGALGLWRMPLAGGEAVRLGTVMDLDWNLSWSPDGRTLAIDSKQQSGGDSPDDWHVWVVSPETGERTRVTQMPSRAPAWSPEGDRLYFVGYGETATAGDLWEIELATGESRAVTDFGKRRGRLGTFALDNDGEFLYYLWEDDTADLWMMDFVDGR